MEIKAFCPGYGLVEHTKINLSNVQGLPFDSDQVSMKVYGKNSEKLQQLFEFSFRTKEAVVPRGFDYETIREYSRIRLEFETSILSDNPFDKDLGTGFKSGDDIGCLIREGLTTIIKERLTCSITIGKGPYDNTFVDIMGYDEIKAFTKVTIWLGPIKTLPKKVSGSDYIRGMVSLSI